MDRSDCDAATPTVLAHTRCPRTDTNIVGLRTGYGRYVYARRREPPLAAGPWHDV